MRIGLVKVAYIGGICSMFGEDDGSSVWAVNLHPATIQLYVSLCMGVDVRLSLAETCRRNAGHMHSPVRQKAFESPGRTPFEHT